MQSPRRIQFSIRTLLGVAAIVALPLGLYRLIYPPPSLLEQTVATELKYGREAEVQGHIVAIKTFAERDVVSQLLTYASTRNHRALHTFAFELLPEDEYYRWYLDLEVSYKFFAYNAFDHGQELNRDTFRTWFQQLFLVKARFPTGGEEYDRQTKRVKELTNSLDVGLFPPQEKVQVYNLHEDNENVPFETWFVMGRQQVVVIIVQYYL